MMKRDEAARILCEIIDDDAPLHWARYRSVVDCIVNNERLLELLNELKEVKE